MKNLLLRFFQNFSFGGKIALVILPVFLLFLLSNSGYAQACTFTDYNNPVNKATITLSTTANTSGSVNVLKDGNDSNNSFYYTGTAQAVAGKEYVRMQFPSPTVLQGFELVVGAYLFSNGAVMQVDGSNDGSTWTTLHTETETASVTSCLYGTCPSAESYSFPTNTTAYTYYRLYGVSGTSRLTPYVNELYFSIAPVEQSGLTDVTCNNNGTQFNLADDYLTFSLNPVGGTGNYTVSVSGTTVSPTSAPFGSATTFTLPAGTAGGGDRTLTVSGFTAGCQVTETIVDPGACPPGPCGGTATDWNLAANKSTITASVTVSNSPSPSDP
ncbi:MAG: hypothetical protein KDD04_07540, partial [Sinomicrobium sp.]|nr:hypothetical protein [Sinomicrobium sp.]